VIEVPGSPTTTEVCNRCQEFQTVSGSGLFGYHEYKKTGFQCEGVGHTPAEVRERYPEKWGSSITAQMVPVQQKLNAVNARIVELEASPPVIEMSGVRFDKDIALSQTCEYDVRIDDYTHSELTEPENTYRQAIIREKLAENEKKRQAKLPSVLCGVEWYCDAKDVGLNRPDKG
jgi:hypothetical protein